MKLTTVGLDLEIAFAISCVSRNAIFSLAQLYYESQRSKCSKRYQVEAIQRFLSLSGSIFRSLGALGVFSNLVLTFVPVCFFFPKVICGRESTRRKQEWLDRLAKSSSESKPYDQESDIEATLRRVISSNELFARERSRAQSNLESLRDELRLHSVERFCSAKTLRSDIERLPDWYRPPSVVSTYSSQLKFRSRKSSLSPIADVELVNTEVCRLWTTSSMVAEQIRLIELMADSGCIRLRNDDGTMDPTFKMRISRVAHTMFWFWMELCVIYAHFLAYMSLPEGFQRLDFLSIVEHHILVIFGTRHFVPPMVDIMLGFRAKMLSLRDVESNMRALLRSSAQIVETGSARDELDKSDSTSSTAAIDVYIIVQLFANNIHSFYAHARGFIWSLMVFVLCVLLPTVILWDHTDPSHLTLLTATMFVLLFSLNGAFLACSIFSSSCMRLSRMVWPLIGNSVYHTYLRGDRPLEGSIKSFMSQHTLLLWRRFMQDKDRLIERFTCTLYESLRLDHRSVIRLNVWLVSLLMLFKNSKDRRTDQAFLTHHDWDSARSEASPCFTNIGTLKET